MGIRQATFEDLAAKQAITEVVYRLCRAMDRMDRALALSCWHPGGTDDHSPNYSGSAEGFIDWLWPVHAAFLSTRHAISNILIDLHGESAGVEAYCAIVLRARRAGEIFDLCATGRYLDRFERIDGVWAIRHRISTSEWHRIDRLDKAVAEFADAPLVIPSPSAGPPLRATRDTADPSYGILG